MSQKIRLLLGGSPCTHWSIAQTKNRETEPSGIGWELFRNYLVALRKYRPDYFLYENNKSMAPAIRAQITRELGVEPVLINSDLVSAQSRQRLYWFGKRNQDGTYSRVDVEQPEDRGILLRDILESGIAWQEKGYCLKAQYSHGIPDDDMLKRRQNNQVAEPAQVLNINPCGHGMNGAVIHINGKSRTLTTNKGEGPKIIEPVRIGTIESAAQNADFDSQQYRAYSPDGKSVTLCGNGGGVGAKTGLYAIPDSVEWYGEKPYPVYEVRDGLITIKGKQHPIKLSDGYYIIRKLTVRECMRLQTVPETYVFPVSDTQAYKMLGNGWTVDVIAHILSHIPEITSMPVEVLSMYDGMSCGHIALDKLGANVARYYATEIDKYAIKTTLENYPDTVQLGDAFQVLADDWDGGGIITEEPEYKKLDIVPMTLREANAFVEQNHRHHGPVPGQKFSIGLSDGAQIVGVAIVGRPVARHLDDGWTLEVNRLCTDGSRNACSMLYAAAWRAARAMGYKRLVTYILESENGASLRAAGWKCVGQAGGLRWTGERRPEVDLYPAQMKIRFEQTEEAKA